MSYSWIEGVSSDQQGRGQRRCALFNTCQHKRIESIGSVRMRTCCSSTLAAILTSIDSILRFKRVKMVVSCED